MSVVNKNCHIPANISAENGRKREKFEIQRG